MSGFLQVFNSMIPTIFIENLALLPSCLYLFYSSPQHLSENFGYFNLCAEYIYNEVNIYIACLFSVNPGILNKIFT